MTIIQESPTYLLIDNNKTDVQFLERAEKCNLIMETFNPEVPFEFYWRNFSQIEDERNPGEEILFQNSCQELTPEQSKDLFNTAWSIVYQAIIASGREDLFKRPNIQIASAVNAIGKLVRVGFENQGALFSRELSYFSRLDMKELAETISRVKNKFTSTGYISLLSRSQGYELSIFDSILFLAFKRLFIDEHIEVVLKDLEISAEANHFYSIGNRLKEIWRIPY